LPAQLAFPLAARTNFLVGFFFGVVFFPPPFFGVVFDLHLPLDTTAVLAHLAMQALAYVLPSFPQTGAIFLGHLHTGFFGVVFLPPVTCTQTGWAFLFAFPFRALYCTLLLTTRQPLGRAALLETFAINVFLIALAAALHPLKPWTGVPLPTQLTFPLAARTNFLVGFFVAEVVVTQTGLALAFPFPVLPVL